MKTITKAANSESTTASFTHQFVSEGAFLNVVMAYEHGWGPVPSATSMAILAEQRGSGYASSRSATVPACITAQEPRKARMSHAPTLRVVIPSSHSASSSVHSPIRAAAISKASSPIPNIEVVPPTPTTPRSPIHPSYAEEMPECTFKSYYDLARRAPLTERVPHLPQFCPHSVRSFVPPHTSGCELCARQLLACDIWFSWSSALMDKLRVPPVLPATCSVEMRSIYYTLGIPLGEIDQFCVDRAIVNSIIISRRTAVGYRGVKKPATRGFSRMRTLFRRARHVLGVPLSAPVMAMPR